MKLLVSRVMSAALLVTAMAASAQAQSPQALPYQTGPSPYATVSDVGGPYMAPDYMPPRYAPVMLLPPREIYMIVREDGYEPLGLPQQRGLVYTMAVMDGYGEDGRLVIDARNGRILRFLPAFRMGDRIGDEVAADIPVSRPPGMVPSPQASVSLPPASMPIPPAAMPRPLASAPRRVASRSISVPLPKPTPPRPVAEPMPAPLAAAPAPPQQSAAVQPKPAEATPPAVTTGQAGAKPAVRVVPTQQMPPAQGLD